MQSKATPREKRAAAKRSQMSVASQAGVSLPTLRLYEANPAAVSEASRLALDAVYAKLRPYAGNGD